MKRLALLLMFAPLCVYAQTGVVQGHCYLGGKQAITSGMNSTNYMDGNIPACTVTVYLTGTLTKQTITKPDGSALANPFTANTASAVDPGGWVFRAATNQGLDVVLSGGNSNPSCITAPLCYTQPVTLVDVFPTQSFSPVSGLASATSTLPIQVNGGTGPVTSGNVNVSCANNCAAYGQLLMQINPPAPAAQQYILYPTSVSGTGTTSNTVQCGGLTTGAASCSGSGTLANGGYISHPYCNLNCSTNNIITWSFPSLPSFINPANVTSIYGGMVGYTTTTTLVGNGTTFQFECGKTSQTTVATTQAYGTPLAFGTYTALLSGLVGTDVPSITCDAQMLATDPVQAGIFGNMPSTFLVINYTGSAPPTNTAITVIPPLNFNPGTNSLSLAVPFDVGIDTGAANAYAVSLPWTAQRQPGTTVKFLPAHASTSTTPTFNLNGIGAATIVGSQGGTLQSGDLNTTATAIVVLDNAGNWRLQDPQVSGSGGSGVTSINTVAGAFTFTGAGVSCTSTTCTFSGGGSTTLTQGTPAVGNSSNAVASSPYQLFAHAFATGGTGTEASPWTNADNTGGIQTAVNSLIGARGGEVDLAPGRFEIFTPITLNSRTNIPRLTCLGEGYNDQPNGDAEGTWGCKLRLDASLSSGIAGLINVGVTSSPSGTNRANGTILDNLYLWGTTATPAATIENNVGLSFNGWNDQTHVHRLGVSNFGVGIEAMTPTGYTDDAVIDESNITANGYGAVWKMNTGTSTVGSWFNRFYNNSIFDNTYQAIATYGTGATIAGATNPGDGMIAALNVIGRGCTVTGCSSVSNQNANIYWERYAGILIGNQVWTAGYNLSTHVTANGVILNGSYNNLADNNIIGQNQASESGVLITGSHNYVHGNMLEDNTTQVTVASGALDNYIDQPGITVSDSGTRTVVNELSTNAGDPNSAGNWNGQAKWNGLSIWDSTNNNLYYYLTPSTRVCITCTSGVTSFSGDGALLSNSSSTGAVTATLANAAANTVWGNETGSSAAPSYGKVALASHATQAADTVVMNATGGSASPTAVSMPTCTTGADLYNTTTHTWSCVSTGGGSGAWTNITGSVTVSGCTVSNGACAISGTTTTAVTFSVIPGTYNRLQIVIWGQGSATLNVQTTFNSDASAHYALNGYVQSSTTAPAANATASQSFCAGSGLTTGNVSQIVQDIPFYASTSFAKAISTHATEMGSTSALGSNFEITTGCSWDNGGTPAAITSITWTASTGHYVAGTEFMILGQN